jgi:NAD(P)H-flavin reductase
LRTPPAIDLDPWATRSVKIKSLRSEAPCVVSVELELGQDSNSRQGFRPSSPASACDSEHYRFAPGQFNMLYVPGVGEAAISIAGQKSRYLLKHTLRSVGAVTEAIEAGGVGMSLGMRGPFGTSWPVDLLKQKAGCSDVIIAAGGIGIAPLRALIEYVVQHRTEFGGVQVLVGSRTPEDLIYQAEYEDWRAAGIEVQTTVDRPTGTWRGQVGVITLLLDRLPIAFPESTLVLSCGPEVMMRYVAKSAIARGIGEQNIWVTLERNMNCAIGLCGHCQLGPEFVCKDGPVFRYDRVRPWLIVQEL